MSNNNYGNSNNGSGNNDYWISKSFIKSIRSLFNKVGSFAFGFVFAVSLLAGVVYAWNAVWHGTDWIQPGAVIDSQKVAENFEWLNRKIDELSIQINHIINNTGSSCEATSLSDAPYYMITTSCGLSRRTYMTPVYYPYKYLCPNAQNNEVVRCMLTRWYVNSYIDTHIPFGIFQCINGQFKMVAPAVYNPDCPANEGGDSASYGAG